MLYNAIINYNLTIIEVSVQEALPFNWEMLSNVQLCLKGIGWSSWEIGPSTIIQRGPHIMERWQVISISIKSISIIFIVKHSLRTNA